MRPRPGQAGEKAAEKELRRRGMTLLARNVREAGAEIDLVALDGDTFVFVAVKSRRTATFGDPAEAVDVAKRRNVVRAARAFLAKRRLADRSRRYDVAAVLLDERGRATSLRWTEAAFDEGEAR